MFKLYKYTNDQNILNRYNLLKKQNEKNVFIAKRNYNNNLLLNSKSRTQTSWCLIKNVINNNSKGKFSVLNM